MQFEHLRKLYTNGTDERAHSINKKFGIQSPSDTIKRYFNYCEQDTKLAYDLYLKSLNCTLVFYQKETNMKIKKVIFNDPATIVFWDDNTKTVVQVSHENFDPEKGLAMAIAKKALGNKGCYYEEFKKWIPKSKHQTHNTAAKVKFADFIGKLNI